MRPARATRPEPSHSPELKSKGRRGFIISTLLYIVIMVIAAALFISFGYKLIFKEEPNASPTTQLPPDVQNQQADTVDETANWKTYTNEKFGYSIKYPENWKISSPGGGQAGDLCQATSPESEAILLSSKNFEGCGFVADYIPSDKAEIILSVDKSPYSDTVLNNKYSLVGYQKIIFAGQNAAKYKFTRKSEGPAPIATTIYFNKDKSGFVFYLQQPGVDRDYERTLDQILFTFKFLE